MTPPPELVQQWRHEWNTLGARHPAATDTASYVAHRAAQWGADRELDACCEWLLIENNQPCSSGVMRAARRPKPPSLKDQALDELAAAERLYPADWSTIRRALEALPNEAGT